MTLYMTMINIVSSLSKLELHKLCFLNSGAIQWYTANRDGNGHWGILGPGYHGRHLEDVLHDDFRPLKGGLRRRHNKIGHTPRVLRVRCNVSTENKCQLLSLLPGVASGIVYDYFFDGCSHLDATWAPVDDVYSDRNIGADAKSRTSYICTVLQVAGKATTTNLFLCGLMSRHCKFG